MANNFNFGEGKALTSPEPSLEEAERASEIPEGEAEPSEPCAGSAPSSGSARPARGARARPGSAGCVVTPWRRACPPSQRLQVRGERGLRSVSRGASASACFYFKTWRQLKTSDWCQYFFFFSTVQLFLEAAEPVAVESEGDGIFPSVWQQLTFPVEAPRRFSRAARPVRPGGRGPGAPSREEAAGARGPAGPGSDVFIAPQTVFLQPSGTVVQVQIWQL